MAIQKALPIISHSFSYSNDFLKNFHDVSNINLIKGTRVKFDLRNFDKKKKLNPLLKIAKPTDARVITDLIKEVYNGTYPYKEMEDETEVRKMIESGNSIFVLFKNRENETIGTTTFVLDRNAKKGNMRTWVVKKEYQGRFESTKSLIGCCIYVWLLYRREIFLWYGEVRTAHAKTQYILDLCTLKAVAFYPNKDVFYNKIESDILQVSYNKKALTIYRSKKIPAILPEIENCYLYSKRKFNLGKYFVISPDLNLNLKKIEKIKKKTFRKVITDKFNYTSITFSIENSDSYFSFLYTPLVQNFENTKYKIKNLEELFIFAQEFIETAKELNVRYCEVFVSAYHPFHQKVFLQAGLKPRGYVPSWDYNHKKQKFEDRIAFNYYKGEIDNKLNLTEENKLFLQCIDVEINENNTL